jgi:hypothetical protein
LTRTRAPKHVDLIFEQIDRRMQRLAELSDMNPPAARRILLAS